MKINHTPAPWHTEPLGKGHWVYADGGQIAAVYGRGVTAESDGNLALILAAPDLLALAKRYASECAHCNGTGREPTLDELGRAGATVDCAPCADIRAVINKAEGRL